jgi:hypothetical protein
MKCNPNGIPRMNPLIAKNNWTPKGKVIGIADSDSLRAACCPTGVEDKTAPIR